MSKSKSSSKSTFPSTNWKRKELLSTCGISLKDLNRSGLNWRELGAIYNDHVDRTQQLTTAGNVVFDLLRTSKPVHSVRMRVKNPGNLIRKIVRKTIESPNRFINFQNYTEQITDLVGIRALHLFKEDWSNIHSFIKSKWNLAENPTAYVRTGDHKGYRSAYEGEGCDVKDHPRQYRSVHYLVELSPTLNKLIVEIQVRTLMEEAWSEIDHLINYPAPSSFDTVQFCLAILNRLAGSADELASFVNLLETTHRKHVGQKRLAEEERDNALTEIEITLKDLKLSESKRAKLAAELKKLKKSTPKKSKLASGYTTTVGLDPPYSASKSTIEGLLADSFQSGVFLHTNTCDTCGKDLTNDVTAGMITVGPKQCDSCRLTSLTSLGSAVLFDENCEECGKKIEGQPIAGMGTIGPKLCNSCSIKRLSTASSIRLESTCDNCGRKLDPPNSIASITLGPNLCSLCQVNQSY